MTKQVDLNKLSAAQLVLIHNAVTTGKPAKKFESQGKAMERVMHVLGANSLTLEQGARMAGLLPAYNPDSLHVATNLLNGELVSVANLHGPVGTPMNEELPTDHPLVEVLNAPFKSDTKAAAKAQAKADAAKARDDAKAAPKAAASNGLTQDQERLLTALIDCSALAHLPREERVGAWVRSGAVYESASPHGLDKRQVPGVMGALSRRGYVECGPKATVRLRTAAIAA